MILISHRGNIDGPNSKLENHPDYIFKALDKGYHVEVDVWWYNDDWFLGHDEPTYRMREDIIELLNNLKIFLHCKNKEALSILNEIAYINADYFWHQNDDYVLTRKRNIWVYPNKPLIKNSICVLPELGVNGNINECYGICSDYIKNYE